MISQKYFKSAITPNYWIKYLEFLNQFNFLGALQEWVKFFTWLKYSQNHINIQKYIRNAVVWKTSIHLIVIHTYVGRTVSLKQLTGILPKLMRKWRQIQGQNTPREPHKSVTFDNLWVNDTIKYNSSVGDSNIDDEVDEDDINKLDKMSLDEK